VEYVRRAAGRDRPFFLYVPFNAPHYPLHAPAHYVDRFRGLSPERRIMAAMLASMDEGVGAILEELARAGLRETPSSSSRATTARPARRATGSTVGPIPTTGPGAG